MAWWALHPLPVSQRLAARPVSRALPLTLAVAIVVVAVSPIWLAVTSDHVQYPVATGLYRGYLAAAPMLIGAYWWRRRPASRFGQLLMCFGVAAWVVSWQSLAWPLAFDLGVLAEAPFAILTFWLFLAFPSGRLESPAERVVIAAWTVGALAFFLPWVLGSPVIAGGGPLSG